MVIRIRMSKSLHNHIKATAAYVGKSKEEILQSVCRSYLNSRPVVHFNVGELYYIPGDDVVSVRGVNAKIVDDDEFRKYIYRRCQEEREKKFRIFRSYAVEAGISSRPPETLEEAEQMACSMKKTKKNGFSA